MAGGGRVGGFPFGCERVEIVVGPKNSRKRGICNLSLMLPFCVGF